MKMAENVVIPSLTIPVVKKKKKSFFFFLFSFLDHCPSLRASWLEEMVARNEQLSLIIDLSVTKINGSLNQRTRQKEPCRRGEFQPPLARHGDRLYVCESNFIHNGGDDGNNTKFPARPTAYFSDKDMKSHQCVCVREREMEGSSKRKPWRFHSYPTSPSRVFSNLIKYIAFDMGLSAGREDALIHRGWSQGWISWVRGWIIPPLFI